MKISQKQLRHLLSLSKITANIKELKEFKHDINSVIELFNDIEYIDTKNIEPMISPLIDNFSVQLNNIPDKKDYRNIFEDIAPQFTAEHFIVPQVIE